MMPTSRVNVRKLVRDLAEMYQDDPFDVVITELVANALDAKAGKILLDWDDQLHVLIVEDDGKGMNSKDFEEYHDFAAELKGRGDGIGFAGVGAKISFNIADRVVTKTRHGGRFRASDWHWDGHDLHWEDISSTSEVAIPGGLNTGGTRVEVHFDHKQVPKNIGADYLEDVLKRHSLPLFVNEFVHSY